MINHISQPIKLKSIASAIILSLSLVVSAIPASEASIFGPSADTKKNVATIKKLGIAESKIIKEWDSVIGANYQDDYTTGMTLIGLLPKVNVFITKLEALSPKDKKLQDAINLWVDGWNKQAEGLAITIAAIDTQDYAKAAKGNSVLATGRKIIKRGQQALAPFLK
jgi:hypothetical protein